MFAAAVLVARWIWDGAKEVLKWIAVRAFAITLMILILPWVLRNIVIWFIKYMQIHGHGMVDYVTALMAEFFTNTGMETDINIELSGIGGFFAIHTGVIEYISILMTGYAAYWYIIFITKTLKLSIIR